MQGYGVGGEMLMPGNKISVVREEDRHIITTVAINIDDSHHKAEAIHYRASHSMV